MMPRYQKMKETPQEKYYTIGYSAYLGNHGRETGDDLPVQYRPLFRKGWDDASKEAWTNLYGLSLKNKKPQAS